MSVRDLRARYKEGATHAPLVASRHLVVAHPPLVQWIVPVVGRTITGAILSWSENTMTASVDGVVAVPAGKGEHVRFYNIHDLTWRKGQCAVLMLPEVAWAQLHELERNAGSLDKYVYSFRCDGDDWAVFQDRRLNPTRRDKIAKDCQFTQPFVGNAVPPLEVWSAVFGPDTIKWANCP